MPGGVEPKGIPPQKLYDPANQRPQEVRRGDLAVSLAGKSESFQLNVASGSAATQSVPLPSRFEQVNDLRWSADGRLLVQGMFTIPC